MKKKPVEATDDELRPEYAFERSRPNRFAKQFAEGSVAVVLDPDVAAVFTSSESVNTFLRSAIEAMPQKKTRARGVPTLTKRR